MKFFFHYNKPLSKRKGRPIISLHTKGKCYFVDNIVVDVKTAGRIRKRQPFFVIEGFASKITVENKIGYIT